VEAKRAQLRSDAGEEFSEIRCTCDEMAEAAATVKINKSRPKLLISNRDLILFIVGIEHWNDRQLINVNKSFQHLSA
jgi:hypothetical protein